MQPAVSTIRLFNSVPVEFCKSETSDSELAKITIPHGFVFETGLNPDPNLVQIAIELLGFSGEKANASFHKSWEKIKSASIEQLVVDQILHYLTTYGFESLGVYDASNVYIPNERLELPGIEDGFRLIVIRGMTSDQLLDEIIKLGSGVALSDDTLTDVMAIVSQSNYDSKFTEVIQNRELLSRLYDHYDLVPDEPVAFLRHLIYKLTENSLLIKNDALIEQIKTCEDDKKKLLDGLIDRAPKNLASIFYRFKPLFLAMKSVSTNKTFFNKLRKDAVKIHEPLAGDYLATVTEQIKNGVLDLSEFGRRIKSASIFRKIRLAHALNFRLHAEDSIVYTVRNGAGWSTGFQWSESQAEITTQSLEMTLDSIVDSVSPKIDGRTFLIPSYVNYALPASEKQFAGPIPSGSYVTTEKNTVFGIHWTNCKDYRVDLDLSLLSSEGKIGWDAAYRNESALFSGDMTDAPLPNGATELFYVKNGIAPHLVLCNYFNFSASNPVEAKLLVASEAPKDLKLNYMVDVNRIVAKADINITRKQTVMGLVLTVDGQTRFYFGNVSIGCQITSTDSDSARNARNYLTTDFTNRLDLKKLIVRAGGKIIEQPGECDFVDLSPESLNKSSILDLFLVEE